MMNHPKATGTAGALATLILIAALASCTSESKSEPQSTSEPQPTATKDTKQAPAAGSNGSSANGSATVAYTPGEAGGVATRVVKGSATVSAIDASTRSITLTTDDGSRATFKAPPEMHNFDQLRVGDKVNATLKEQLAVIVGPPAQRSDSYAAVQGRAPKGARPGAMAAEMFETIATVKAIDSANRRATLQFAEGETATVPVREDVDLTKYKAGDSVVIRVTQQLTVLVERP